MAPEHAQLSCRQCHQQNPLTFRLREAKMLLSFRSYQLADARVCLPNNTCTTCHDLGEEAKLTGPYRVRHTDFLDVPCSQCHEQEIHAFASSLPSPMLYCARCHSTKNCYDCHLEPKEPSKLLKHLALDHGPTWEKTHGGYPPGLCAACHSLEECARCHPNFPHSDNWPALHSRLARMDKESCFSCHRKATCSDCHGLEMPHPEEWRWRHATLAVSQWTKTCARCHTRESCLACHEEKLLKYLPLPERKR